MKKILLVLLSLSLLAVTGCSSKQEKVESKISEVENIPQDGEVSNVYYYNFLSDESKTYYDLLLDASLNYSNTVSGSFKFNAEAFDEALYAFSYDYPLYYWWRIGVSTSYSDSSFKSTCKVDASEIEENVNKIIEEKDRILAECKVENNYSTIQNIYEYIVNEFTYDMDNPNGHSLLGGIIDKKCVCDGYASTFKYLCNEAGFNCNIVDGVGINNDVPEEHAWNLVQLNNKWYNVDATWGSANTATGKTIIYDYFLVSDDILSANHYRNGEYNYPSCDDESLFYFNMPGKYIKAYNDTEVCDSITSWINEGYKQFNLKFASNEDGQKACSELLEGGKFVKAFEKAADANYEITYGGSYDESAHMLRIYYEAQ